MPDKLNPSTETRIRFLQTLIDIEALIQEARGDLSRYAFDGWTIQEAYGMMTDGERWLYEKVEELTDQIGYAYHDAEGSGRAAGNMDET